MLKNDNFLKLNNIVNNKEKLIELLKSYKSILNNSSIDYLNDLIELKYSVINNIIDENDRNILSELSIYKKIALYNIYNRALKLFKEYESELKIKDYNDGVNGLSVFSIDSNIELYSLNYYSPGPIIVSLFQTIKNEKIRLDMMDDTLEYIEELYAKKNNNHNKKRSYVESASYWNKIHQRKIEEAEELFNKLDNNEISDLYKKKIELTKKYHELLFKDYGLLNDSFHDVPIEYIDNKLSVTKKFVKTMTNIRIEDNIEYI